MAYDPSNVFAKILRKELPCVKVYEDEATLAFMDIMPSVDGHTLVITKEPAEGILDLSPEGASALIRTTQKVAKAVKKSFGMPRRHADPTERSGRRSERAAHPLPRSAACRRTGLEAARPVDGGPERFEPIAAKIRAAL